jgi:magnesium chelatase subunit D
MLPTSSVDAAASRLASMPTGGQTPLAAGLAEAHVTLLRERLRDPLRRPLLVVVTDGRHTAGGEPDTAALRLRRDGIAAVVVDCEGGPVRLGLAGVLAETLGAVHLGLENLSVSALAGSVRAYRQAVQRDADYWEVPREVA